MFLLCEYHTDSLLHVVGRLLVVEHEHHTGRECVDVARLPPGLAFGELVDRQQVEIAEHQQA